MTRVHPAGLEEPRPCVDQGLGHHVREDIAGPSVGKTDHVDRPASAVDGRLVMVVCPSEESRHGLGEETVEDWTRGVGLGHAAEATC